MQAVVQEINTDYQTQPDTTKANISYDVLEMSGSRAVWPEVLAIYAVKTTTDPDNAQEVATMDDSKKAILKDIFWQMNEISSRTETKTEEVITRNRRRPREYCGNNDHRYTNLSVYHGSAIRPPRKWRISTISM